MSEPAPKSRWVWLENNGRLQDVFVSVDALGADLRREAKPRFDSEMLAYVRLLTHDALELAPDEKVPVHVGVGKDTSIKVVVDPLPDAPQQATHSKTFIFLLLVWLTPCLSPLLIPLK